MIGGLGAALAARAMAEIEARRRPGLVLGLAGPQGSGKSTLAADLVRRLDSAGLRAVALSLDDLYLTREERAGLAATVHPLLATRGPPGTHDVALGTAALYALATGGAVHLPRFDKGSDTRGPTPETVQGPFDVIILEGWCVGARPQSEAALREPVNALERDRDPDGAWRRHVNAALAGDYQRLFDRLDRIWLLRPPDFDTVLRWRRAQERTLGPAATHAMDDAEVATFVQHFERLTRHLLAELPTRADAIIDLDAERRPVGVWFRNERLEA